MTIEEFGVLVERHRQHERREDWRAAVVATIVANAHRGKHATPAKPHDFFPSLRDVPVVQEQSPEVQLTIFKMITGAK